MDSLEKAFTDQLKESFDFGTLNPEVQKYFQELSRQQKSDFTPTEGFFSNESKELIARQAAGRLAQVVASYGSAVAASEVQAEWQKIVVDFHQTQYWGQPTQRERPPKVLTEEQKRTREIFPYIWIAFQALILMKTVIGYFGWESAENDETSWGLYAACAFSVLSLVGFAWRRYKKGE